MVGTHLSALLKLATPSLAAGLAADLVRSKQGLVLENALLRQQLIVLNRSVKRPTLTVTDRGLLVLLASWLRTWASALVIVKPDTCVGYPLVATEALEHGILLRREPDARRSRKGKERIT